MLRENMGKLAIILAGGGCLALMMFVMWPQMFEPAPSMTPGEIVEEVLGPEDEQPNEAEAGADEMVMPVPSPLVAVSNDGEEVPVIFPAPEGEMPESQETGERARVEAALPLVLSAKDVAAVAAALEGDEEEAGEAATPVDAAEGMTPEDWVRVASAPDVESPEPDDGQAPEVAAERDEAADTVAVEPEGKETTAAEVVVEPRADATEANEVAEPHAVIGASDHDAGAGDAEPAVAGYEAAREAPQAIPVQAEAPEAVERRGGDDEEAGGETVLLDGAAAPPAVEGPLASMDVESQAPQEASDPSGELPSPPALEAGQADGPKSGLSPQRDGVERTGVVMPDTLRGVMGYRLPLVSRQEVPDQIVSGVLIPAHTTFVILKEGSWELVDVSAAEVDLLRQLAAEREAEAAAAEPESEPEKRGWNPLRMLKQPKAPADE